MSWNINNWVEVVSPTYRRKPVQLAWLRVLLAPLKSAYTGFLLFKSNVAGKMQPNGQTLSLEWYLNNLYDNVDRRIFITSNNEVIDRQYIYNATELVDGPFIYLDSEGLPAPIVYNSIEFLTGNFFTVHIPTAQYSATAPAVINRYKLAGAKYIIKLI